MSENVATSSSSIHDVQAPSEPRCSEQGPTETAATSSQHSIHVKPHSRRKMKIKTLEKKLKILDRQIKKCSETELTMEDMESGSSVYMKEDLYKRKFIATWQELCEVVNVSDSIEVEELGSSAAYSKSPYPEINRRVQRLVKLDEFPDHFDIVELIERCDTKHTLGISAEEKSSLSRQIFKDVGRMMKERRQRDFVSHFGSHLTDGVSLDQDPALSDDTLLTQLKESLREAKLKMEQVCEGFVTRQEHELEMGKSPDDEGKSQEEDSEDSESDDEHEQDNALDSLVDSELDAEEVVDNGVEDLSPMSDEVRSPTIASNHGDDDSKLEPLAKRIKLDVTGGCDSPVPREESEDGHSSERVGESLASSDGADEPTPPNTAPSTPPHTTTPSTPPHTAAVICIDSDDDSDIICIE